MIEKRNLDEQVSDWIWAGILERKFNPGTVLSDIQVAAQVGVSRSTARAALNRLAEERPLIRKVHGGWGICPISADDAIEMYSLRSALECMAVEILCTHIDDVGRANLQSALSLLKLKLESGERRAIAEADLAIHEKIVELTRHKRLIDHYKRVLHSTLAYVMLTNSRMGGAQEMTQAHEELISAIAAGDTSRAVRLTKEHLIVAQRSVVESLQDTALAPA